jgi:intein/homing endonuclease
LVTDEVFQRQAPQPADERAAPLIICFAGKGGVGKCLVSDTTLTDPVSGVPRRLDEVIADPGAKWVFTLDDGEIKAVPIADKIDSGMQPTFKVTLRSGRHITATANHPLLLADGWRPLDAIEPGETIAVPARMPHPLDPVPLDPAVIDILAVLVAEGGLTGGGTVFTSPDPVVVSIVEQAARALGFVAKLKTGTDIQYQLTCPTRPRRTVPRGLCECGCGERTEPSAKTGVPLRFAHGHGSYTDLTVLLRHHGIAGHTSRTKPMPDAIWRLPGNQLARFLNVFWGCDGYVTKSGIPELALANEPLLRAVQHLLLRFGVQSTIRYKKARCRGKDFDAWSLRVHAGSVASFAEHFPLWGEKGARLLARAGVDHNPNLGGPTVTDKTYEEIASHRRGLGVDDAARLRGWGTKKTSPSMLLLNKPSSSGRRTLSLTGLAAYAKAYGLEAEYGWIYSSDIYWDEVVSVGPAGVQQVWDLSVDNTHCFIADDVVVHNSTAALALAQQAAAAGLKAVVVDANRGQGDLRKYLRVGQAYLPSVVDAAVSGDPERAITSPERLAATRPSGLPALAFGVVLAPTDAQADPALVTPDVYRSVVRAVRGAADLVVVDTQIVEAADTSGMVERFLVPELLAGAWGLGLSDTSVGVDNLLRRLYMLSARGVGPERLMVALNRVEAQSGLNQEAMVRLMQPYATWMGAVGMDPAVATAFESGAIPASPELAALLDRVLARVTGLSAFAPEQKGGGAKTAKTRRRWLRWR